MSFPQPPRVEEPQFNDWLIRFWKFVLDGVPDSTTTVTETATTSHSSLSGLNTSEYTHLSAINAGDLTDSGDSALHFHSADRDRSNHTGTQPSSTISDFTSSVLSIQADVVLEAQVFGS